jgi:hypothetical protein
LKERKHLRDNGVDGRIILNYISKRQHVSVWTGLKVMRTNSGGHGNEFCV